MCGIVGVGGSPLAAIETLQALMVLQHRGQDAAGILAHDLQENRFHLHKEHGLIAEAIPAARVEGFSGTVAIGHNRYATTATKQAGTGELQPQFLNFPDGLGLAHNGNLVNAAELREWLARECRRHLVSHNDVEVLLNLIAEHLGRDSGGDAFTRLARAVRVTMEKARGGYAVVGVWGGQGLFAFRDPQGLRPLVLGRRELPGGATAWMVASETNALRFLDYLPVREVAPGELVLVDEQGVLHAVRLVEAPRAHCFFEWIYFSTAESQLEGHGVYRARLGLGEKLAHQTRQLMAQGRITPDVVVPVPDTSRPAAIALAEAIGVPYRELLIKNRYVQRSFILPTQSIRERAVHLKLTTVSEEIRGKKVLLVDDSVVRGTTSRRLIKLLREAGATAVYLASTCPPIKHPCYFGIDFPEGRELVASTGTHAQIADRLGADEIIYQTIENLEATLPGTPLCKGCLTGKYPFDITDSAARFRRERQEGATC